MKIVDNGVLAPSFMDFSTPSEFARNALYYTPQFGHFICDRSYHIERSYLDQYLLLDVGKGALHLRGAEHEAVLEADQIGLIDCHVPHAYWCVDYVDF